MIVHSEAHVVHVNAWDASGGAAKAVMRLHNGILATGRKSQLAVYLKSGDDENVVMLRPWNRWFSFILKRLEQIPFRFTKFSKNIPAFNITYFPASSHRQIKSLNPDIVHLHWVAGYFFPPFSMTRLGLPVVWTLHDTWGFTGGCHVLQGCERFLDQCGQCPQMSSNNEYDFSRLSLMLKQRAYRQMRPIVVSPSKYLKSLAQKSFLMRNFRVEHIPNGLDTTIYAPRDKSIARELLGLPVDGYIILFGAFGATSDYNKGFDLLQDVLRRLPRYTKKNIYCVVFGSSQKYEVCLPYPVIHLGILRDDVAIALAYSASDSFVCSSREENLPNTIMEASSCGRPTVAFSTGGIPEMIDDKKSGYLCPCYDTDYMAQAISWILEDEQRAVEMGHEARKIAVFNYSIGKVAESYNKLYDSLCL